MLGTGPFILLLDTFLNYVFEKTKGAVVTKTLWEKQPIWWPHSGFLKWYIAPVTDYHGLRVQLRGAALGFHVLGLRFTPALLRKMDMV